MSLVRAAGKNLAAENRIITKDTKDHEGNSKTTGDTEGAEDETAATEMAAELRSARRSPSHASA